VVAAYSQLLEAAGGGDDDGDRDDGDLDEELLDVLTRVIGKVVAR
jgi:hypothetical protein